MTVPSFGVRSVLRASAASILRQPHQHSCGHSCSCALIAGDSPNCASCRHEAFMAYLDGLSTEQLLERRG